MSEEDPAEKHVRRLDEKEPKKSKLSEVSLAMIVLGIIILIGLLGWMVYSLLGSGLFLPGIILPAVDLIDDHTW